MLIGLLYFFFNDTATTEIYTLSLHDALPIFVGTGHDLGNGQAAHELHGQALGQLLDIGFGRRVDLGRATRRSEEHTSELQSRPHLVCRLLLEKKHQVRYVSSTFDERVGPRLL